MSPGGGGGHGRSEDAERRLLRELGSDVVDHTLRRRATLAAVGRGQASSWELCDAHPHLLSAARHYGVITGRSCPLCKRAGLIDVHFVYGESLRHVAGQAKTPFEVRRLATVNGQVARRFDVYVVEVCTGCRWNHLLRSFVVGPDDVGPDDVGPDDARPPVKTSPGRSRHRTVGGHAATGG